MIYSQCGAPNCAEGTRGYSKFCRNHARTKSRHGDINQGHISAARIAPYLHRIRARIDSNIENAAWEILARRWQNLVEDAERTLTVHETGAASSRHRVEAARQIRDLGLLSDSLAVVREVAAVYLLAEAEPRAFTSDRGFAFQLVRRVRGLAPSSMGTYWSERQKKVLSVRRDTPPRVIELLAAQLIETFGDAGMQLARLEHQPRVDPAEVERKRLAEAIEALR